jgi:uncharacterized protein YjbI with pentapeptide repeats
MKMVVRLGRIAGVLGWIQCEWRSGMETRETMYLVKVNAPIEARKCCLTGSKFLDVNLGGTVFDDVNLAGARIKNVNLSDCRAEDVNFTGLQIRSADLRGASIAHCLTEGMTIDGVAVSEMMAAYRKANP